MGLRIIDVICLRQLFGTRQVAMNIEVVVDFERARIGRCS